MIPGPAGPRSIPLAREGYEVTIVDPSRAMLARAEARLAAEPPEVARRVRLICASAEEARGVLGGAQFASVLCHGVLMYVEAARAGVPLARECYQSSSSSRESAIGRTSTTLSAAAPAGLGQLVSRAATSVARSKLSQSTIQ